MLSRRSLAIWGAAMAVLGWVMMTIGAFVRATESGLGCPDWPTCHGQLVAGGHHALVEEFHRWVATGLVVGVVGLVAVVIARYRRERRVLRPALATLALLALQVVLGGITVVLKNVAWTVVAHYGGAALLVAAISLLTVRLAFPSAERAPHDGFRSLVGWFAVLTYGLLLAGSTLANAGSDGACGSGFPLCNGTIIPGLTHDVAIILVHRVWAGAMLLCAVWVFLRSRRDRASTPPIIRASQVVLTLFVIQAIAGIVIVSIVDSTASEVVHSSLGSLSWLAVATLVSLTGTLSPASHPTPSDALLV